MPEHLLSVQRYLLQFKYKNIEFVLEFLAQSKEYVKYTNLDLDHIGICSQAVLNSLVEKSLSNVPLTSLRDSTLMRWYYVELETDLSIDANLESLKNTEDYITRRLLLNDDVISNIIDRWYKAKRCLKIEQELLKELDNYCIELHKKQLVLQ